MVYNDTCKGKTIFIVDDVPENIYVLSNFLDGYGFEIQVANNVELFLKEISLVKPDIVLLDILMPDIDGFEACRLLKERDEYRDIPIIFMSALSSTDEKVKGLTLGAADYITKPINHVELLARVNVHLALKASKDIIAEKNIQLLEKNENLEKLNSKLTRSLNEITALKSLLPICSSCKKIHQKNTDPTIQKSWINFERYLTDKYNANFTHGICPDCIKKLYPKSKFAK